MSPPAVSDGALVATINAGLQPAAERAFETLYRRHRDFVYRVAFRTVRDADLAADATADAFADLVRRFPGFTLTAKMTTFLYPVARHCALAAKRRARKTPTVDPVHLQAHPSSTADPAATHAEDLLAVLSALSDDHREVVLLRVVDGFSLDEIAGALGVPLGTVKSRLHHALKQLRGDPSVKKFFEP